MPPSKKRRKKPVILPRLPSKLLSIALADLEAVEKLRETYTIEMGIWHDPDYDPDDEIGKCAVCFAGSVMARSLKARPDEYRVPEDLLPNKEQLYAIDCFRGGCLREAGDYLGYDFKKLAPDINFDPPFYEENRRGFKAAIRKLIRDFRKAGL